MKDIEKSHIKACIHTHLIQQCPYIYHHDLLTKEHNCVKINNPGEVIYLKEKKKKKLSISKNCLNRPFSTPNDLHD